MGSSPLARGLLMLAMADENSFRIIPARAGFTSSRSSRRSSGRDHPRSRGVYLAQVRGVHVQGGSSPLARGLHCARRSSVATARIIPARAGFTPWRGPGRSRAADHPRSRGVYRAGSTPAARRPWIIPARAGFTGSQSRAAARRPDHPRSRGVYRIRPRLHGREARIIPARAGFTCCSPLSRTRPADHPRSRGVYAVHDVLARYYRGSSPLARGLPADLRVGAVAGRIIPARAGFTGSRRPGRPGRPDHPRSRGVYLPHHRAEAVARGSSPLARGLPHRARARDRTARIIPARAGFTRRSRTPASLWRDHPRSRGVYWKPPCG